MTSADNKIEFRLRYPLVHQEPKTIKEVRAFNEDIEKIVVNEDVVALEDSAEVTKSAKTDGLNEVELEEERERKRKAEEIRPEEVEKPSSL